MQKVCNQSHPGNPGYKKKKKKKNTQDYRKRVKVYNLNG